MPEERSVENNNTTRDINAIEKDVNTVLGRMGGDKAKDRVARTSINNLMKEEYDKFVQDQKQAYLDSLNARREQEAKDNNREFKKLEYEDLDAMQRIEADNYKFSDEEKKKYLESTFDKTKDIIHARNDYLNGDLITKDGGTKQERADNGVISQLKKLENELATYQEKIDKFDGLNAQISEIQEQLGRGEITPEQSKKMLEPLESEKEKLDVELSPIDDTRKKVKELQEKVGKKIGKTLSDHELAKKNAIDTMGLMYGNDLVYSLNDGVRNIDDIAPKGKLNQEYLEKKNAILKNKPEQSVEEAEKEDDGATDDSQTGTNDERELEDEANKDNVARNIAGVAGPIAAGAMAANALNNKDEGNQLEGEDEMIVDDGVEQAQLANARNAQQEQPLSYMQMLGYDPSQRLNFSRAESVLDNFLSDKNKANQLEILKDPEASKVIMDSMKKISKNINPFKLNEVRNLKQRLLNTGELKGRVAQLYADGDNIPSYDEIKEEYSNGKEIVDKELENIKVEKGEDSPEYLEAMDKTNSLTAVMNFEEGAKNSLSKGSFLQDLYDNYHNRQENGDVNKFLPEAKDVNNINTIDGETLAQNIEDAAKNKEDLNKQKSNFVINEFGKQGVLSKGDAEIKEFIEREGSESLDSLTKEIEAQEEEEKKI